MWVVQLLREQKVDQPQALPIGYYIVKDRTHNNNNSKPQDDGPMVIRKWLWHRLAGSG